MTSIMETATRTDTEARLNGLLDALTLEEQVLLLAGANFWMTVPIERLGIPAIKVTDGPNGARGGGSLVGGVKAACFPVGIALASTWNTRNFECYSEDPFLSSQMCRSYIVGLQGAGVAGTIKHFVGNESEFERMTISSEIDERALREIYLPPFEAAVKDAHVWAVMAAYNRLGGTFASEHPRFLTDLLRNEWGFDGVTMSDWFATHSTAEAANAGLDLEMPGPTRHRGERLVQAVHSGEVSAESVRASARRVLRLIARVGAFDDSSTVEEQAIDRP